MTAANAANTTPQNQRSMAAGRGIRTENTIYQCSECPKTARGWPNMYYHLKKHHNLMISGADGIAKTTLSETPSSLPFLHHGPEINRFFEQSKCMSDEAVEALEEIQFRHSKQPSFSWMSVPNVTRPPYPYEASETDLDIRWNGPGHSVGGQGVLQK
jgi:hypothetical protein